MNSQIFNPKRDVRVYQLAREFLLSYRDKGITDEVLEKHLRPRDTPKSVPQIYLRVIESAQNAGMGPNVLGNAIGGLDKLQGLLCNFDPQSVVSKYHRDSETLLNDIERELRPKGKLRREKQSLWPRFSNSILSGAAFMAKFESATDFYNWVNFFDSDDRARPALPLLLDREIKGFGFALACDFLKELGYVKFGKPDVHLKKIFKELRLSETEDDYEVFNAIVRIADNNTDATPYRVDKLFWLIGSGKFDNSNIRIGRKRQEFLKQMRPRLIDEGLL